MGSVTVRGGGIEGAVGGAKPAIDVVAHGDAPRPDGDPFTLGGRVQHRRVRACVEDSTQRLRPIRSQARPANARASAGRAPASASLGRLADVCWPAGHTGHVFHAGNAVLLDHQQASGARVGQVASPQLLVRQ